MVADLLDELDLHDVTVVGNDTGGGLMQLLVTSRRPERISKLVFTNCDALEVFPPWMFKPLFALGSLPAVAGGGGGADAARARAAAADRLRVAEQAGVVGAARALGAAGALRPRGAARRRALHRPGRPGAAAGRGAAACRRSRARSCSAWGADDRCFPVELGRRLAAQFRDARFVEIADSYAFVPIDRPDALAPLI